jgi:hypothetical protein
MKSKFRAMGNRELQNIYKMKMDELISGVIVGEIGAGVPKLFSFLLFNFLDPAFLDSPDRTLAKSFSS